MQKYASHSPLLALVASRLSGGVLELGAGISSTCLLHGLCSEKKRKLVTVESALEWMRIFHELESPWHSFRHVSSFVGLPEYTQNFELVFIDHGIAGERGVSLKACECAPVIICHDTNSEYRDLYNYNPLLDQFRFRFSYRLHGIETMVVSNFVDVLKLCEGI